MFTSKESPFRRPIVYGSTSRPVTPQDTLSDPSHSFIWTVYLRGVDGEDISYFIDKVEFKLHESFASPIRGIYRVLLQNLENRLLR
jgi:YEATS domain-containing protein 4